jgi:hypothetical protein
MPRKPTDECETSWSDRYGTASGVEGNLPEYKIHECVDSIIDLPTIQIVFPWVTIDNFHFYHIKCPYSNESPVHYVRNLDKTSEDYWKSNVLITSLSNHTSTSGMMIKYSRGSHYGWLCVDPSCPYYLDNGVPYFYR